MKIQLTLADLLIIGLFVYLSATNSNWWMLMAAVKLCLIFTDPRRSRDLGWRWRRDD